MKNLKVGDKVKFITNTDLKHITLRGCTLYEGIIIDVKGLFKRKYVIQFKQVQGLKCVSNACTMISHRNIVKLVQGVKEGYGD